MKRRALSAAEKQRLLDVLRPWEIAYLCDICELLREIRACERDDYVELNDDDEDNDDDEE